MLINADTHRFLSFFICENLRDLRPYLLVELECVSPTIIAVAGSDKNPLTFNLALMYYVQISGGGQRI